MYKVSILVPIYQVEPYIERCARSLFEQTYPDLEYVFVNDCTPDNSIAILKATLNDYPNRKDAVKIIDHEKNRGLAAARNTALDHATGAFVSVVDSDDWLERNAIALLVDKQIQTDADIVSGSAHVYRKEGADVIVEPVYKNKQEMVLGQMDFTMAHVIWRRLIRRSLYEDHHIRCMEGCDMTEDRYQMVLLSYYAKSFARIDDYVYHYERRNEQSFMNEQHETRLAQYYQQMLQNWIGIETFFADKETEYYQKAIHQIGGLFVSFLKMPLKHKDKNGYHATTAMIDQQYQKYWPQIRLLRFVTWRDKGVTGWLMHNYPLMRIRVAIGSGIWDMNKELKRRNRVKQARINKTQ